MQINLLRNEFLLFSPSVFPKMLPERFESLWMELTKPIEQYNAKFVELDVYFMLPIWTSTEG